jgi:hypothetical protein
LHVSLMYALIHRVLGQGSATPTVPVFQYPITSLYNHPLSIGSSVSHCDNSCVPIFDSMSAWFMHSSIEYWVKILPLWPIWSSNIRLYVSLISILVMWVLGREFRHSDYSTVSIFDSM